MTYTCPEGHTSESGDYCDTCGAPITPAAPAGTAAPAGATGPVTAPLPATGTQTCPHCAGSNPADALFCEACGYDFTTGAMPRPPATPPATPPSSLDLGAPAPAADQAPAPLAPAVPPAWVAEVWVDPDWYAAQESEDPCPSPGPPTVVPLSVQSVLVGRRSTSRNIHPQIDCSADVAVSRRQAQLTTDGRRWWVEDLQSSNGTYVGPASGPLPLAPLTPGQRHELDEDDRIYLGAWTRLVIRRATPDEQQAG